MGAHEGIPRAWSELPRWNIASVVHVRSWEFASFAVTKGQAEKAIDLAVFPYALVMSLAVSALIMGVPDGVPEVPAAAGQWTRGPCGWPRRRHSGGTYVGGTQQGPRSGAVSDLLSEPADVEASRKLRDEGRHVASVRGEELDRAASSSCPLRRHGHAGIHH
jgi:hypothetical protein